RDERDVRARRLRDDGAGLRRPRRPRLQRRHRALGARRSDGAGRLGALVRGELHRPLSRRARGDADHEGAGPGRGPGLRRDEERDVPGQGLRRVLGGEGGRGPAGEGAGARRRAPRDPFEHREPGRRVPGQQALVRRRPSRARGPDSVWTGDHVSFHNPMYESLTLLASYVPITSRVRLGTAVYLLALRPPAIAAKITSTLDALSGGRLIFGVGVGGENPKEFEVCGVPHGERGARVSEAIDVVRTLWRDTPATFKGRFTQFSGVSLDP